VNLLHVSALPIWSMDGKGGMPSLRETLRGHLRGGHQVVIVLPKYQLFREKPQVVAVREDAGYEMHLAPCRWVPPLLAIRRGARWLGGGKELPYVLRWMLNLAMCLLLTASLTAEVLRLRRRTKRRYDLVYAHNQYAALAGWILGRVLGVPNVTRLYGTFLADLIRKPLVTLRYPVATSGYLVPHSLLICGNDGTRGDEVARKLRIDLKRFRFWQNGVAPPEQPPDITRERLVEQCSTNGFRPGAKWIVSCSRLSYWKRIDRILHAVQHARAAGCDCQLIVAGDGPARSELLDLADSLGVAENVFWLGAVAHDQIWSLMHVADAFAISNDVTNRCNPLYEAIYACLPVVSVRDPSTADLLDEEVNALLADKGDTDALGQNIVRVLTDDELAASMRQAQQERSRSFWSWEERMATEVRELEQLVREHSADLAH
jgi:glycosyltransferase involved in cell wall biosynthesis